MAKVEQKVREHYHLQTDESGNMVTTVTVTEENFDVVPDNILKELQAPNGKGKTISLWGNSSLF